MRSRGVLALAAVGLVTAFVQASCGGGGEADRPTQAERVRAATSAYLQALREERWTRACRLMTSDARRELGDAGGSCAASLAGGAALSPDELGAAGREVAGARVRVRGRTAAIGPLGSLPQRLRLERVGGRWLIAG
jgi:hypothetical protein